MKRLPIEIKQEHLPDDSAEYSILELGNLIHFAVKRARHHSNFGREYWAAVEMNNAFYYREALDGLLQAEGEEIEKMRRHI